MRRSFQNASCWCAGTGCSDASIWQGCKIWQNVVLIRKSPGIVVIGGVSCSRCHGFKSKYHTLDALFTLICFKNCIAWMKKTESNRKSGCRWPLKKVIWFYRGHRGLDWYYLAWLSIALCTISHYISKMSYLKERTRESNSMHLFEPAICGFKKLSKASKPSRRFRLQFENIKWYLWHDFVWFGANQTRIQKIK